MLDLNWLKKWQINGSCHSQDPKQVSTAVFREVISACHYGSVQESTQSKGNAKVKGNTSYSTARAGLVVCWVAAASHGSGRAPSTIRAVFVLCQKAGSLSPNTQTMTCTLPNTMCSPLQNTLGHRRFFFNDITIRFGISNQLEFPASSSQKKTHWEFPETFRFVQTSVTKRSDPNHSNLAKF